MLLFYYRFFSDNEYPVSENIVGEEVFNISDVRVCVCGGGGRGGRGIGFSNRKGGREQAYRTGRMYLFSLFLRYNKLLGGSSTVKTCSEEPVSFLTVRLKCANKSPSIKEPVYRKI